MSTSRDYNRPSPIASSWRRFDWRRRLTVIVFYLAFLAVAAAALAGYFGVDLK